MCILTSSDCEENINLVQVQDKSSGVRSSTELISHNTERNGKKQSKHVRFESDVTVCYVTHVSEISFLERLSLWWQRFDYETIIFDAQMDASRDRKNKRFEKRISKAYRDGDLSELVSWCENGTARGLEKWCSERHASTKENFKKLGIEVVLKSESKRNRAKENPKDTQNLDEQLRRASEEVTRASSMLACIFGYADAKAVQNTAASATDSQIKRRKLFVLY